MKARREPYNGNFFFSFQTAPFPGVCRCVFIFICRMQPCEACLSYSYMHASLLCFGYALDGCSVEQVHLRTHRKAVFARLVYDSSSLGASSFAILLIGSSPTWIEPDVTSALVVVLLRLRQGSTIHVSLLLVFIQTPWLGRWPR